MSRNPLFYKQLSTCQILAFMFMSAVAGRLRDAPLACILYSGCRKEKAHQVRASNGFYQVDKLRLLLLLPGSLERREQEIE